MPTDDLGSLEQEKTRQELYQRFSKMGLLRLRLRRVIRGVTWLLLVRLTSGAKRIVDVILASVLLLLFSPLLIRVYLVWRVTGRTVFDRTPRVGRWCEPFDRLSFARRPNLLSRFLEKTRILHLPVLFNILKGDMSFIGPRPVSAGELSPREKSARKRYDIRPGLIGLWWLRQRSNIAYEAEAVIDAHYVETHSVLEDLAITLRAIPAAFYGGGAVSASEYLTLLGIPIRNLTMSEALSTIAGWLDGDSCRQVCFVNADCANIAYRDSEYLSVLQAADLSLADGIGLMLAGKLLGREIKQNVNGTDLFPRLCEALAGSPHGIYLLGARPGVAESVRDWIALNHPGVRVVGLHHGYYPPEDEERIIDDIAGSGASVLLVAFGAPRQDTWISKHLKETGASVALGVGGLFDFYSGRISRAPQWMREIGFEWIYRFWQEPGRMWKRYLVGNAVFMLRVLTERFRRSDTASEWLSTKGR